tara:strand:- start:661 stop:1020 length:360 start_codon:yes stop_codon:yes gene_type:complete
MGDFAAGKYALGICDRSGLTYKLKDLMPQVKDGKDTGLKVSRSMLDPDQPQLWLGRFPVKDPQAVRGPRPETGLTEQRDTDWNWNPVGDKNLLGEQYGFSTQDSTQATGEVGSVTVTTT